MLLMKSAGDAIVCVRGSFRFAPAENAPPASSPVRTAQRISSSSSMAAKWRAIPSLKSEPHALRASGRLRVTMPIGPRRSNVTGMPGLLPGVWVEARRLSTKRGRERSVAPHHDIRGLDHRVGIVARREAQLVHRFIGDGRGDDRTPGQLDPHVRRRGTFLHLDDLPLENVSRAELHRASSPGSRPVIGAAIYRAMAPASPRIVPGAR